MQPKECTGDNVSFLCTHVIKRSRTCQGKKRNTDVSIIFLVGVMLNKSVRFKRAVSGAGYDDVIMQHDSQRTSGIPDLAGNVDVGF